MPTPAEIRTQSMLDANAYIASRIWAMEDDTAAEIRAEVVSALERLTQAVILIFTAYVSGASWSASDSTYRQRTDALSITITTVMAELDRTVTALAFDAAIRAQQGSYYGTAWVMANTVRTLAPASVVDIATATALQAVAGVKVQPIPIDAIRALILAPYKGSTFLDRFINSRDEFVSVIKKSVVESQVKGEGIAAATRRLRDALGLNRTSPGGYLNRVEAIARTEILRSSNAGAMRIYEQNKDVLKGWEWLATKDERTCPVCGALDGKQYSFDDPHFKPPAHVRCRCTAVPVLIDSELERLIVGPRVTYADWVKANGITMMDDGGVPRLARGAKPPKSVVKESLIYPVKPERLLNIVSPSSNYVEL